MRRRRHPRRGPQWEPTWSSTEDLAMRSQMLAGVWLPMGFLGERMKETNGNTEDENIDNGNISTDRTDTGSPSDEVNI